MLKNKVILITGSTQGLGKEIAKGCLSAGCGGLIITGRECERELGIKLEGELSTKYSKNIKWIACELSNEDECRNLFKSGLTEFGHIDCLVNSAAVNPRATLANTTVNMFTSIFRVNLLAPFILTQELTSHLLSRKAGGGIVNISSVQAHGGAPFSMAYSSLKSALVTMTKNNGKELARNGIRINAVLPGWMPTENENALQLSLGAGRDWIVHADAASPTGKLLRPEQCANAVVFFLSDMSAPATGVIHDLHPEMITGCLPAGIGDLNSKL